MRIPRSKLTRTLIIVGLLALILVTYGGIVVMAFFHRPLGPELVLPEPAPAPVAQAPTATPAGPPQCGGPHVMTLMTLGTDTLQGDYTSGFADVIRVARIDFVTPSAILLSVPRDLWVAIPGLESQGIIENRIKSAYAYGYQYDVPGGGPSLLAQTLDQNFRLKVDHYLVVNFLAFEAGINHIGGIDVEVPGPLGSPDDANYFPGGWQHMDGHTALTYARLRGDSSDLYRIDRQTQVLLAIRQKALSPQILPVLPGMVEAMRATVLTDLTPAEISSLECIAQKIDPSALYTLEIDESMMTRDSLMGYEVMLPDYPAIAGVVATFNAGGTPSP
jgi:LCP family protein required for cell wall assembly